MGRLVQQTSPSRADREHSSRRGRGRLLCPACYDPQRRVGLKQNGLRETRGGSKASNPRLRTTMVELAWLWLKNQPTSALSLWFHERVQRLGGRMRKTIIVALARKLLVALWRYMTAGVVIEGAVMKPASATI